MKPRENSLERVLRIGQVQEPEWYGNLDGYFDENNNYVTYCGPYHAFLYPWEWTVIPEIVRYAEKCGVEIPKDLPVDTSRAF